MSRLRSEDFIRLQFYPRLIVFVLDALASNLEATDVTDLLTDELERLLLIDLKSIKAPTLDTDDNNATKRRLSYFVKAQLINFDDNDSVDDGSIPASRWTKMLLGVVEVKARFVARHLVAQIIKQEGPPESPQLNAMILRETAARSDERSTTQ
jgi:hypothetical protein